MKAILIVGAAMLLSSPVLAQSAAEKTGINSAIGLAPKTQDFVQEAATGDMFEIESSKLALVRSDAPTQKFAQQMITDHQKTTGDIKKLVASGKVQVMLPTKMTSAQTAMLDKLKALNGTAFTAQYHSDQVSAHKDAVDLFTRYGKKGDNAALKDWAAKTRPALQHHLRMAEDLNK